MNFLNRALTHTKVACTWDEPELDNKRNEILFKDDMEDKIDLDDYIAPGIDQGYDPDDDEVDGDDRDTDHMDIGIDEGASCSDEDEELPEDEPKKKLKTSDKISAKSNSSTATAASKLNIFSDFDKKNRQRSNGLKITFKNPLEMGIDTDENPLGKRVYSLKFAEKKNKLMAEGEDTQHDFFTGEDGEYDDKLEEDEDAGVNSKDKLKNMKFKDRMREKKRQAKLDKEQKRDDKKAERNANFNKTDENLASLALVAGERQTTGEFKPDYKDSRFGDRFDDHDMAVDPTSTYFKKDKHMHAIRARKLK